jgi:nucleoside-diphosphate-sugar epimerase
MKNILIIGGSYFIGRVFTLLLTRRQEYSIHILNRGNRPLKIQGVEEHICDRNETERIKKAIPSLDWDVVVDFCADFPHEISSAIKNLPGKINHYIYFSTCAVYKTSVDYPKYEDSPKLSGPIPGPFGDYGYKKYLTELELIENCESRNINYTILRPAFVYGPYNYAPRESYFFDLILSDKEVPVPSNSISLFQFVYVTDIANICIPCLGNSIVYGNAYNLSAEEMISYQKLINVFEEISGVRIKTREYSCEEIERRNIPLPFPMEQHELYSGLLISKTLNFKYTPFAKGMKDTFEFYKKHFFKHR